MLLLIASITSFGFVYSERQQIGHFPIKGNLWRAKFPHEIQQNLSASFTKFARKCVTSLSPDTGIQYYVSHHTAPYKYVQQDDSICVYSLERNLPNARLYYGPEIYATNFTVYFACDEYCCGLECCQRDIPISILGFLMISIACLIVIFYIAIYSGGLICAWRNGALGQKLQINGKSPEKRAKFEETRLVVIRNRNTEEQSDGRDQSTEMEQTTKDQTRELMANGTDAHVC